MLLSRVLVWLVSKATSSEKQEPHLDHIISHQGFLDRPLETITTRRYQVILPSHICFCPFEASAQLGQPAQ